MRIVVRFCLGSIIWILLLAESLDAQWAHTSFPANRDAQQFVISDGYLIAVPMTDDSIIRSSDNGNHWSKLTSGLNLSYGTISSVAKNGKYLFASVVDILDWVDTDGIFRSSDDGETWKRVPGTGGYLRRVSSLFANDGYLFAIGGGFLRSTNNGVDWSPVGGGVNSSVERITSIGHVLFAEAQGDHGGVWRSNDTGTTWQTADSGISTKFNSGFASCGSELFLACDNFYRSLDSGRHWLEIFSDALNGVGGELQSFAISEDTIFGGSTDRGLFISIDSGATWKAVNDTMSTERIETLLVHDGFLFAGTMDWVWRRPLSDFNTVQSNTARDFSLSPNYPNPFTTITSISFTLPSATRARLSIYDLMGREVARPVDEVWSGGKHAVTFDASGLAAGVYVCRLEAGGVVQMREILCVR
jgi:photosystem II stability/assembly factor-like uncharacterized protein